VEERGERAQGEARGGETDRVDDVLASWSAGQPDLTTTPLAIIMRINRLSAHFLAEMDAGLAQFGLTYPAFELLATLRRSGSPYRLPQRRIADTLGLTPGTVSLRVKHMVSQGLVMVQPDPADKRVTFVGLTDRGVRAFDAAAPAHLAGEEDLVRALSAEEQAVLAPLLRTLLLSFEGSPTSLTPALAAGLRVATRSAPGPAGSGPAGVTVTAVTGGSLAARAGIRRGDVITAVAGRPVRSPATLSNAISLAGRGQVTVDVYREGVPRQVTWTVR